MNNNFKLKKEFSINDKLRILKKGLKPNTTVKELCEEEGISPELYYEWYKKFLKAGKEALLHDYGDFEINEKEKYRIIHKTNELLQEVINELGILNNYIENHFKNK